ncbi:MAG: SHOCT domain-containing protein [Flavobacteriales bacterium]|nr:SHOCT domain-containing protein [Flavobacteriales bacterium]
MSISGARHRSNINFVVTTFFGLIAVTTGFYIGLISSKGPLIETGSTTQNGTYYQNLWQNRPDVFNLFLVAIAYTFIMFMILIVFGKTRLKKKRAKELEHLEKLGDLFNKGLLTREEFNSKKEELLDDEN